MIRATKFCNLGLEYWFRLSDSWLGYFEEVRLLGVFTTYLAVVMAVAAGLQVFRCKGGRSEMVGLRE